MEPGSGRAIVWAVAVIVVIVCIVGLVVVGTTGGIVVQQAVGVAMDGDVQITQSGGDSHGPMDLENAVVIICVVFIAVFASALALGSAMARR